MRTRLAAALAGLLALPPLAAAQGQQQGALPNGANSLQETYQDWTLSCGLRDNRRICALSQDQLQQNGQRLMAVEITPMADGAVLATFLLPFGIVLDKAMTPQVDEQEPLQPIRFRTCLPAGCLARANIDRATFDKLRSGTVLKLHVVTDAESPLTFTVSLKGLTAAMDRLQSLSGS